MNCQPTINEVFEEISKGESQGEVASYIPELGKVDPEKLGVCVTTVDGRQFVAGDSQEKFSIQSIAKVLALSLAFDLVDDEIWKRLGVEPAGTAFNSLVHLESEEGIPRNPLINSGALVVCDILCSKLTSPKEELIAYIRKVANNNEIDYSDQIAQSEKLQGYRNYALINFLKSFDNIHNEVDTVLEFYFQLCSIEMSCAELSKCFAFLANQGRHPETGETILSERKTERINAIMQTCGFYDEAGEFAYRVGLPGKSGVGGGIVAIRPDEYAIAVWSPRLNEKGNSYRGMKFLEMFTTLTEGSIF
ncbi:MAG: glutaminase [Crocinitomicaceae bacterium]